MTIFAILMPSPQPQIVAAINKHFFDDFLVLSDTQYLISTKGTAVDLVAKLGIYDAKNPQVPHIGNAVVFATSSYFGRAPATVWDWMKAKLESSPSG